jgi:hypothetical protein
LSGLGGFSGNNISLGTNTKGNLTASLALDTTSTVTDAIAQINQLLGNITDATGSYLTTIGNVTAGNVNSTFYGTLYGPVVGNLTGNVTGNVLTASQPYITSLGTLTSLTVSGNVTAGNVNSTLHGNVVGTTANFSGNVTTTTNFVTTAGIFWANGANYASTVTGQYGDAQVAAFLPHYGGNIFVGNINVNSSVYTDTINGYTGNVVTIAGPGAVALPTGSSGARPLNPQSGYTRYNTELGALEYYNGTSWVPVVNGVSSETLTADGINNTFTLTKSATADSIIVDINGVLQHPLDTYTVTNNTITFIETPVSGDSISIRFIALTVAPSYDQTVVDSPNVTVGTSTITIDSFSTGIYRTAKYTISASVGHDFESADILCVQNGTTALINTYSVLSTGNSLLTYSATINSGQVLLQAVSSKPATQLRIQKTYFNI